MIPKFFIITKPNIWCYIFKLLFSLLFPVDVERQLIISHF